MRVLLSTIGSRGEAQPMVALASRLTASGQQVVMCGPPDFHGWAQRWGVRYVPVGPRLRTTASRSTNVLGTAEQRRLLVEGTIADQFAAVDAAAEGCDVVVAGGALAIAAHSVAERRGIGYVYTAFAPVTLPSPGHAPPPHPGRSPGPEGTVDNDARWAQDAQGWNLLWGPPLNARRAALGLPPVTDVRDHLLTATPWLAADPTLAPWPGSATSGVVQTGAWILPDDRPLPDEVRAFLDAGDPPVYVGFGSVRAPDGVVAAVVGAARALGRRVVVGRGWAELAPVDDAPDCLPVGEVNQQALFARVAVVVHHGGAGTTTTAARAGVPQVIVPQVYDQFYFAGRVERLGVGVAHPPGGPTVASVTAALDRALRSPVAEAARTTARAIRTDGAATAARRLVQAT
ncbi:glycosyltransferase [Micromonospora sp. NBRC 101691]|uniref:glycosyltransferase n=1 Tax=Micromonospora sp. NBRC 101691 TaxID=3032198 RepID=UPI0024A2E7D2|nr:glycosyltransferase [Micromonospora sp. NBRC 101691]GLY20335.1 glycosyl transferase [Micromonospora sp. NBRC 101691]